MEHTGQVNAGPARRAGQPPGSAAPSEIGRDWMKRLSCVSSTSTRSSPSAVGTNQKRNVGLSLKEKSTSADITGLPAKVTFTLRTNCGTRLPSKSAAKADSFG